MPAWLPVTRPRKHSMPCKRKAGTAKEILRRQLCKTFSDETLIFVFERQLATAKKNQHLNLWTTYKDSFYFDRGMFP